MKKIKIVADSSSDVMKLKDVDFSSAPLKIITGEREFVDDSSLDIAEMVAFLEGYHGRSSTSCPNPEDWLANFGDAEEIYCVTITSALSGSYNSACMAKQMYEEKNPGARVCVIDSLSTGPEMALIIKKIEELILAEKNFDEIRETISHYQKKTGLLFMLESMKNLANNGRVSKVTAKLAGLMNIRVVGRASDKGELEPLDKPRGQLMTIRKILERLECFGYEGGRIHIAHCMNMPVTKALKKDLLERFPKAEIFIDRCRGLCSFYAERGGVLVGFERA